MLKIEKKRSSETINVSIALIFSLMHFSLEYEEGKVFGLFSTSSTSFKSTRMEVYAARVIRKFGGNIP